MQNKVLVCALMSLVFVSLPAVAQISKPSPADPSGRWIGEYKLGNSRVFLVVRLTKENEKWTGVYNRPTLDWENQLDLGALSIRDNRIRFDLGEPPSIVHVDVRWARNSLRGTISGSVGRGTIKLQPSATLSKDYLDTLAGDYEIPGSDSYVIQRENSYLCFLDRRTGRSGRLIPATETEFWTGPTFDIYYPPYLRFKFSAGADGHSAALEIMGHGRKKLVLNQRIFYRTQEVEFQNGDTRLAGTISAPAESGRHPAVVILHGSNYQTRGGQYGALAFVADQFARNGFVALTYDKRGTGKSTGERKDDPELISGDAAAAVYFLRTLPQVDPIKIGLYGLSQGGIIEPIVAEKTGRLAFFINVSGDVINTNEQEIQRTELELRADGFPANDVADAVHFQRVKFHYACQRDNWDEYESLLKQAAGKPWLPDPYIGPPDSKASTAWDFWKCGVEPGKYWEKVLEPVLYVQGEFETISNPRDNLLRLQQAMQAAGNQHFEHRTIPGAQHSMFKARNGGEKEEISLTTYVDGYFELLTDWAKRQIDAPAPVP